MRRKLVLVSVLFLVLVGLGAAFIGFFEYYKHGEADTFSLSQIPWRINMVWAGAQRDLDRELAITEVLWKMVMRTMYQRTEQGELQVGDIAPDVRLITLDGNSEVHLSQLLGEKPLVLIFGSYT